MRWSNIDNMGKVYRLPLKLANKLVRNGYVRTKAKATATPVETCMFLFIVSSYGIIEESEIDF